MTRHHVDGGLHRTVRAIAARMPAELRHLRAAAMLDDVYEALFVEDVDCPACRGSGWLDERRLEHCPVCIGFREVPETVAEWFVDQSLNGPGTREDVLTDRPGAEPQPERLGRILERPYRVHVPEPD